MSTTKFWLQLAQAMNTISGSHLNNVSARVLDEWRAVGPLFINDESSLTQTACWHRTRQFNWKNSPSQTFFSSSHEYQSLWKMQTRQRQARNPFISFSSCACVRLTFPVKCVRFVWHYRSETVFFLLSFSLAHRKSKSAGIGSNTVGSIPITSQLQVKLSLQRHTLLIDS